MPPDKKGIVWILQKSFSLYFKNLLRFTEVSSWICLPVSIIFILFFFWGLPERQVYLLMAIFFFGAAPLCILLLYIVVVRTIQGLDQGKKMKTLGVYAEGFSHFFPSLRIAAFYLLKILLWSWPALVVGGLCLFFAMLRQGGALVWAAALMVFMVAVILIVVPGVLYYFSLMAFLLDGHKGKQALEVSRQMIRPNLGRFTAGFAIVLIWMQLSYFLIGPWAGKVYGMSLLGDLFPILFQVGLVNLCMVVVSIFPVVLFYVLYREFHWEVMAIS